MQNNTKMKLILAAALISAGNTARAEFETAEEAQFKPQEWTALENLSAEQRALYDNQLNELHNANNIDWENVITAVDGQGRLILIHRSNMKLQMIASPSSSGGAG